MSLFHLAIVLDTDWKVYSISFILVVGGCKRQLMRFQKIIISLVVGKFKFYLGIDAAITYNYRCIGISTFLEYN